jgi:YbbR domain-containing protein
MAWHPFRNMGLKVVALVLGTLLWMTVSGQQADRQIIGVPVVYHNKPAGLEITEQTSVVDIHVRGLDSQLRTVLPRDFEARVDLTSGHAGAQSFRIRTDQVASPLGVEVTQVDPGEILTVLEESGSAPVPVRPVIDGAPASGYVVSEMHVEPATVTIVGPQRRVAGASSATTDRVSIQGASSTVTQTVSVGVPDPTLRLRDATMARVTVRIEPAGERTFANARVMVRNVEPGLRAEPTPGIVSVQMRGAEALLGRLDPGAVIPYVDVTGLGPGVHEVPVLVDPRGTLTVTSVRPAQITVNIR